MPECIILIFINKYSICNLDMAAKMRTKHKNKISGLVISMCYNDQKSKFWLFTNPSIFNFQYPDKTGFTFRFNPGSGISLRAVGSTLRPVSPTGWKRSRRPLHHDPGSGISAALRPAELVRVRILRNRNWSGSLLSQSQPKQGNPERWTLNPEPPNPEPVNAYK
jgi:hypothetical protein